MNISGYILFLFLALSRVSFAVEPPERGFSCAGRAASGMDPAPGMDNKSFSPDLVADLRARFSGEKGSRVFPGKRSGLPSEGSPKMLVLLIDFDEYPARPGDTNEAMTARIFGSAGAFPFESLTAYYRRSSYGKLNIGGEVLGWYRAGKRADVIMVRVADKNCFYIAFVYL